MINQIPEINPIDLLYNPYFPLTKEDLAELLGVSLYTVQSWCERKRKPAKPVRKLAGLLLEQLRFAKQSLQESQPQKAA
ncbi:MAG: helix-turn-helix domain-containing protein [Microcoleaceae cyanobacterium MO_207.B10]|nr:helix-turn-helix domain-containing protein [Microcoleaceae cyanobacterium MO_207.B10]